MVSCLTLLIVARRRAHGRSPATVTRADLDPRRVRRYTRALPLLILCPLLLPLVVVSQRARQTALMGGSVHSTMHVRRCV